MRQGPDLSDCSQVILNVPPSLSAWLEGECDPIVKESSVLVSALPLCEQQEAVTSSLIPVGGNLDRCEVNYCTWGHRI